MDHQQKGLLTLIRSAITSEPLPLPEGFDLEGTHNQIKYHEIVPLTYEGALLCGISKKTPAMNLLFQDYCRFFMRSEEQMQAIGRIYAAFDANGIDYLPVKGCNMKPLYPKPELRVMGDADILIRMEQYSQIVPIMESLGFEATQESDHEYIWRSKELYLELHKRLIPSYNEDFYSYFGDGWRLAKIQEGCRYKMLPEDEFIYLFTHFAKHYRDGGIGCRQVVDLWIFRRAFPQLDEAYIKQELEKLQLFRFYQNICHLIEVWFQDGQADETTDFISDFIFQSGTWGTAHSHVLSSEVKNKKIAGSAKGGKLRTVCSVVFPTALSMQKEFPVLKSAPYLRPVLWPVHWGKTILFRRDAIQKRLNQWNGASAEEITTYEQALNYVGLDFHFTE
jgi:hypothetical protein